MHAVLEPARHRGRVARRDEEPHGAQYAPHRITTREGERIARETEEMAELPPVGPPEEALAPECHQEHPCYGSTAGPTSPPSLYARCLSSTDASCPRTSRVREPTTR